MSNKDNSVAFIDVIKEAFPGINDQGIANIMGNIELESSGGNFTREIPQDYDAIFSKGGALKSMQGNITSYFNSIGIDDINEQRDQYNKLTKENPNAALGIAYMQDPDSSFAGGTGPLQLTIANYGGLENRAGEFEMLMKENNFEGSLNDYMKKINEDPAFGLQQTLSYYKKFGDSKKWNPDFLNNTTAQVLGDTVINPGRNWITEDKWNEFQTIGTDSIFNYNNIKKPEAIEGISPDEPTMEEQAKEIERKKQQEFQPEPVDTIPVKPVPETEVEEPEVKKAVEPEFKETTIVDDVLDSVDIVIDKQTGENVTDKKTTDVVTPVETEEEKTEIFSVTPSQPIIDPVTGEVIEPKDQGPKEEKTVEIEVAGKKYNQPESEYKLVVPVEPDFIKEVNDYIEEESGFRFIEYIPKEFDESGLVHNYMKKNKINDTEPYIDTYFQKYGVRKNQLLETRDIDIANAFLHNQKGKFIFSEGKYYSLNEYGIYKIISKKTFEEIFVKYMREMVENHKNRAVRSNGDLNIELEHDKIITGLYNTFESIRDKLGDNKKMMLEISMLLKKRKIELQK